MGIYYNGSAINGVYMNSAACPVYFNGAKVWPSDPVYPAPADYTLRFKFDNHAINPGALSATSKGSWSAVDSSNGVWDWTFVSADWRATNLSSILNTGALSGSYCSILDAGVNTGVGYAASSLFRGDKSNALTSTNLAGLNLSAHSNARGGLFRQVTSLVHINSTSTDSADRLIFNRQIAASYAAGGTSNSNLISIPDNLTASQDISASFFGCSKLTEHEISKLKTFATGLRSVSLASFCTLCTSLTRIPNLAPIFANTNVTAIASASNAFSGCVNVTGGMLDAYNFLSGYITATSRASGCFKDCGTANPYGLAEWQQIPTAWGGGKS